ncbi:MAG TPA: ABC transporter substrate-binding protein, partial [Bradyrhizobium sp.]|nr:ABC transporter substrate-binding protein [Bradyrhizobium sp.]
MNTRWAIFFLSCALLAGEGAAASDKANIVRDLAGRVGPILGSALACQDIARPRIQLIVDKFTAVIAEASTNDAERSDLTQLLDRNVANGRGAVTSGQTDCRQADRQLADLERSIATPALPAAIAPPAPAAAPSVASSFSAATAATAPTAPVPVGPAVRGVTDREIRFGIVAPFSGSSKELGRQMKLGIDTAFNRVNDAGGVEGRMLKLIAADDGFEPTRTADAMKQLYEKDQVFGMIGNVGTATAAVALPYALDRRMLFFGAFTGANVIRHDPPDRYVFNYRASYAEETDAAVRYFVKMRRIPPRQIAVFAQQDAGGDAGFAGVAKSFRSLGASDTGILRLNYQRNTV